MVYIQFIEKVRHLYIIRIPRCQIIKDNHYILKTNKQIGYTPNIQAKIQIRYYHPIQILFLL